jgi:D-arabinose 1-dehydrogenase-like Zn-dependent alcohol dehydrogenase
MKSQAITEYGSALVARRKPKHAQPRAASEVLIEITHCGVCHSDVHFHDGHFDMGDGQIS